VPVYLHDWFGPGMHAMVSSIKSGESRPTDQVPRGKARNRRRMRLTEVKGNRVPALSTRWAIAADHGINPRLEQTGGKVLIRAHCGQRHGQRVVVNARTRSDQPEFRPSGRSRSPTPGFTAMRKTPRAISKSAA